ncbi:hypothetical protein IGI04_024074 [Brassica rapa subsp. trilocularis]|uniref:Uncharacterized protein n=1 Tax=Brassica rapa subsp. trilocularis TaxID=1813537 RepID=A0ABQ7M5P7_BRACM|nr:hypothetical protein IGI04_024074 [Brassica rapa subsp. trilocularis]
MWDYFTMKGDVVKPDPNWEEDEIFYCSICDLEWLNNCLGKRCFVAKKGMETELKRRLHVVFPRWSLAPISVMLVWLAGYVSAAMGKFFLFYLVLIKKVVPKYLQRMKTCDYILATGGGNRFTEVDPSDQLDSSSDEI